MACADFSVPVGGATVLTTAVRATVLAAGAVTAVLATGFMIAMLATRLVTAVLAAVGRSASGRYREQAGQSETDAAGSAHFRHCDLHRCAAATRGFPSLQSRPPGQKRVGESDALRASAGLLADLAMLALQADRLHRAASRRCLR
jgi:hypothetical protein